MAVLLSRKDKKEDRIDSGTKIPLNDCFLICTRFRIDKRGAGYLKILKDNRPARLICRPSRHRTDPNHPSAGLNGSFVFHKSDAVCEYAERSHSY